MILSELIQEFNKTNFHGLVKFDESMKNHTTMRVGGITPLFLEPEDEKSFVYAVKTCIKKNVKYFILGGGSNVIISDEIDFVIISTRQFNKIIVSKTPGKSKGLLSLSMKYLQENEINGNSNDRFLNCEAGANWGKICNLCVSKKLEGFETFSGLPGTVGGATFINASCFGFSLSNNLVSVRYLDLSDFEIKKYTFNQDDWGYKKSPFQTKDKVVLSVEFHLTKNREKSDEDFKTDYKKAVKERALKKHFEAPSAGSVFRNIPEENIIAGKIIEECGLKGTRIGGAKVADWHGNFIINEEQATFKDIETLVKLIQDKVKEEKNICLKCEIIFVS